MKDSWAPDTTKEITLKYWLNPTSFPIYKIEGLDPYGDAAAVRLSNLTNNGNRNNIEALKVALPDSGFVFGTNTTNPESFAEGYSISGEKVRIHGVFMVTPSAIGSWKDSKVTISVYNGNGKPDQLIHSQIFKPTYTNLDASKTGFIETDKPLNRDMETFVPFTSRVVAENEFYISYTIENVAGDTIAVYNLKSGESTKNTAWIKRGGEWTEASNVINFATSLFIDPVVQYMESSGENPVGIEPEDLNPAIRVFTGADRKQLYILTSEPGESVQVELLSVTGKLIQTNSFRSNQITLPISHLSRGIYIVNVKTEKTRYATKIVL